LLSNYLSFHANNPLDLIMAILSYCSYPKGLIISFTLKRSAEEGTTEQKSSEEPTDKTMEESETKPADTPDADKENTGEVQAEGAEDEDDEKEEKGALATHKDNKDVVLREDLKAVFGKFGDVKVLLEFYLAVCQHESDSISHITDIIFTDSFILFVVKFVDFKMGSETGYLRFDEPEASQKARAAAVLANEGGLAVKNFIAVLEPVIGKNTFSTSILSYN